jgi:hypothetical protein
MTSIRWAALAPVLLLAACGGGSGAGVTDDTATPPGSKAGAPLASILPSSSVVDEGGSVVLDASGSLGADGSNALHYAWRVVSGPAPDSPGSAASSQFRFTAPQVVAQQVMQVELTASDAQGRSSVTTSTVTVRDTGGDAPAPANAGPDQGATSGDTVVLDGSASGNAHDYQWSQVDGPAVKLFNSAKAVSSFSAPDVSAPAALTFRLVTTDAHGAQSSDDSVVTVAPHALAGTWFANQCRGGGGPATLCDLLGLIETSQPDRLPVVSYGVARGTLIRSARAARRPTAKVIDGSVDDWTGEPSLIGGTARLDGGELIYTDYLFDAYGADDGDDAQRLALLDPLAQIEPRTFRFDQLFQAAGDQFDAPRPVGAPDHYGDATTLDTQADLTELRFAADGARVALLARFSTLTDAAKPALLVLLDNRDGPATPTDVGFGSALKTARFDQALLFTSSGVQLRDLATGAVTDLGALAQVSVNADGWANALEAALPASFFDGVRAIAAVSGPRTDAGLTPANVAFRFAEPVAGVYNDKLQALALHAGTIDGFSSPLSLAALRAGVSENVRPGPGYHERQFRSGENISVESGENGILQPYGLYLPPSYREDTPSRLTIWMHYRGGKAHSGAAWTPRLIHELGDEHGNVIITPRGRGTSTWYVTQAHQDFFESFADVAGTQVTGLDRYAGQVATRGLLNIDADHIYLAGYSMGGYGTYLFGLLYPDLFAGGFASSGAITQGAWTGLGPDGDPCGFPGGNIPGVGEASSPCFIEANEGNADAQLNFRILDNAREFPIVIHHGSNDELVPITGVQRMGLQMAQLGYRYQLSMFFGYEHYTQAIIDEWADGADYLNHFARNAHPRQVTYKVVPALVNALNTVNAHGVTFAFNPDGAYWTDALVVRDADVTDPTQFGIIDAESFAIAEARHLAVPHAADIDAHASPPQVSTPVYSPGNQTTPFAKLGQDWVDGPARPIANAFTARLARLSEAALDVAGMQLDLGRLASGVVDSDGATRLMLRSVSVPVSVYVNGQYRSGADRDGHVRLALDPGLSVIQIVPVGFPVPPPPLAGTPALAAACAALGAPVREVCDVVAAATSILVDDCAGFGDAAFCSTFGGNLHGLIDTCRNRGGPEVLCKLAEQAVLGAASDCRRHELPAEFCALLSGELIATSEVERYEAGNVARALALQRKLGDGLPFNDAEFPATHNSFNATLNNFPPTISGSDPNQKYSVTDRAGDPQNGFREPMVCHGNVDHVGCTWERPLTEALAEVRAWLDAHPGEVIVLYIEEHLDEQVDDPSVSFDATAAVVDAALGATSPKDLLFRPADHGAACDDDAPITDPHSWINLSRAQIAAAGKQVMIFTGSCGTGTAWPALVHNKKDPAYVETSVSSYDGYAFPTCMTRDEHAFSPEEFATKWTRLFEDSTWLSIATGGSGTRMSADNVRTMMQCGVNMPSLDQVEPSDPRFAAFVWSWAPGQPDRNIARQCALHGSDGFAAAGCGTALPAACTNVGGEWSVSSRATIWSLASCPAGFHFAVPRSGADNERLKAAKRDAGVAEVWLNYRRNGEDWASTP